MAPIDTLKIKLFADGADENGMLEMASEPYIKGLTTNPTLMRKAGVVDYREFARRILGQIKVLPISFEVFSDDFNEMRTQAETISSWGDNVYVKIPVTNTKGETCYKLVRELSRGGIKVNVTAVMTIPQIRNIADSLKDGCDSIISVFAGRVADAGIDPIPIMQEAMEIIKPYRNIELLWASPREILNIIQADSVGCHIITATNDILKKLHLIGKDLDEFSLDTVKMFYNDAMEAGYKL